MASALPAHDKMAHVVVDFIHHKARSIPDEITRAEAVLRALPKIDITEDGEPSDPEAWCMLWEVHGRIERLKELATLRNHEINGCCSH